MEVNGISAGNIAAYIYLDIQIFRDTVLGGRHISTSAYFFAEKPLLG
jgi:hypothetical protein